MRVTEGITWVASCTQQFDATLSFFRDGLGLEVKSSGRAKVDTQFDRYAVFSMPNDVSYELLEPKPETRGKYVGPIVSFTVADLESALRELDERGVEWLTDVIDDNETWRWIYFRAPDGNAYQLQERRPE